MPFFLVSAEHTDREGCSLSISSFLVKDGTKEEVEERLGSLNGCFMLSSPLYVCPGGCRGHKFVVEETVIHSGAPIVDVSLL